MFSNYQRISFYLSKIFKVMAIISPLFILFTWIFIESSFLKTLQPYITFLNSVSTPIGNFNFLELNHSTLTKIVGFTGSLIGSASYIFSYYYLNIIFNNYSNKKIFIHENVKLYKKIGIAIFINGILCIPLQDCLFTLAATLNNMPGKRYLCISFGTPNLEAIISGFVVTVIAWVMQQANEIQQEQQLTI